MLTVRNWTNNVTPPSQDATYLNEIDNEVRRVANILDNDIDYEEGTWTPTIEGSTSGTMGLTFFSTPRYIKIGKLVVAQFYANVIDTDTLLGSILISGFPFSPSLYQSDVTITFCNIFNFSENLTSIGGYMGADVKTRLTKGSSTLNITESDLTSTTTGKMMFSISYQI